MALASAYMCIMYIIWMCKYSRWSVIELDENSLSTILQTVSHEHRESSLYDCMLKIRLQWHSSMRAYSFVEAQTSDNGTMKSAFLALVSILALLEDTSIRLHLLWQFKDAFISNVAWRIPNLPVRPIRCSIQRCLAISWNLNNWPIRLNFGLRDRKSWWYSLTGDWHSHCRRMAFG